MKAHDVRHLTVCPACGKIGDDREMIAVGERHLHGECAFAVLGLAGISKLPAVERGKFCLDQIGRRAMRHLVDMAVKERQT